MDTLLQEALAAVRSSELRQVKIPQVTHSFVVSIRPQAAFEQGLVAVVVPSQDRVGRHFPFCAGVQWTEDEKGCKGWPSLEFADALIERVRNGVSSTTDPDALLSELAAVGGPDEFSRTFRALTGDETMPRIASDTFLLRVQGPMSAMSPAMTALCSLLTEANDLLGVCLDTDGTATDFFACRQLRSGTPLAALFDGAWDEHGWSSYLVADLAMEANPDRVVKTDDDPTQPLQRMIDSRAFAPDSRNTF